MAINNKTFDYLFLLKPKWNSWARTVINQDVGGLTRFEYEKLDVALQYPDLFEGKTYAHLLYKVLRRSRIEEARGFAERLSRNVSLFGRFEQCWQARARTAAPILSRQQPGNLMSLFHLPVFRPVPLMASFGFVARPSFFYASIA